jgi:hypothetical protein
MATPHTGIPLPAAFVTHRTGTGRHLFKNDDFTLRLREFKPVIIPAI